MQRRVMLGAALSALASPALAQGGWPSRPIRLVLPYTPGGGADATARAVAEHLRGLLGQPVVVESRPGAGSMLGAELVARAPKDGYTLLYAGWPTVTLNVVMHRNPPYRTEDFAGISPFWRTPLSVAVHPSSPIRDFATMLAAARDRDLAYGTSGVGASSHLLMERLKAGTGARFTHAPYRGEAPAATDVIGGHLPIYVGSAGTIMQQHRAGTLRIIATTAPERQPALPDVPTFREQGREDLVFTYWHGMLAPAGTPDEILDRLNAGVAAALADAAVRARLPEDTVPFPATRAEFDALIRRDVEEWAPIIRANGIALE
jgi:tripartite-type tricarboxylate transporter receptor subunit TctC